MHPINHGIPGSGREAAGTSAHGDRLRDRRQGEVSASDGLCAPRPSGALLGPESERALQNFDGLTLIGCGQSMPSVIVGMGLVKKATAQANHDLGAFKGVRLPQGLKSQKALTSAMVRDAIVEASDRMIAGEFHEAFRLSPIQGGAGTSFHLTAIEILANAANAKLFEQLELGAYEPNSFCPVHPNDTVNFGQSTNDAVPTAARIGLLIEHRRVMEELVALEDAFQRLAERYRGVRALGRTHLQDATGMLFGRRFGATADMLGQAQDILSGAADGLRVCTLGATAIGTGITALPEFQKLVLRHLNDDLIRAQIPIELVPARNLYITTASVMPLAQYSASLAVVAGEISKVASDLRLLASGPRGGFGEIKLPELQAGSSIMPGKVNPVMLELWNQAAAIVRGNNSTVQELAAMGQLELNVMAPTILYRCLESMHVLSQALLLGRTRCINGIKLDEARIASNLDASLVTAVALKTRLGYEVAAAVSKRAQDSGLTIREVISDGSFMLPLGCELSKQQVDDFLSSALLEITSETR